MISKHKIHFLIRHPYSINDDIIYIHKRGEDNAKSSGNIPFQNELISLLDDDVISNASFAFWRAKRSKNGTNNGKNNDVGKYKKNENQGKNENSDEKCSDWDSIKNNDKADDHNCTYIVFEIYIWSAQDDSEDYELIATPFTRKIEERRIRNEDTFRREQREEWEFRHVERQPQISPEKIKFAIGGDKALVEYTKPDVHGCDWLPEMVKCNKQRRIENLNLSKAGLKGTLSSDIERLQRDLKVLNLSEFVCVWCKPHDEYCVWIAFVFTSMQYKLICQSEQHLFCRLSKQFISRHQEYTRDGRHRRFYQITELRPFLDGAWDGEEKFGLHRGSWFVLDTRREYRWDIEG